VIGDIIQTADSRLLTAALAAVDRGSENTVETNG